MCGCQSYHSIISILLTFVIFLIFKDSCAEGFTASRKVQSSSVVRINRRENEISGSRYDGYNNYHGSSERDNTIKKISGMRRINRASRVKCNMMTDIHQVTDITAALASLVSHSSLLLETNTLITNDVTNGLTSTPISFLAQNVPAIIPGIIPEESSFTSLDISAASIDFGAIFTKAANTGKAGTYLKNGIMLHIKMRI